MKSLRAKFLSLGMALVLALSASGCAITTPAVVGSIGGVEIPAGIYLLAQYNAYSSAASAADLATGETADDVRAVLNAQCTGTIGDEEVTTDGADYVARLTLRSLQHYAAVETLFDELGGTLSDAATSEAADQAESVWSSSGDLYAANGIGKDSLEAYLLNAAKATELLQLFYGENGQTPVTDEEYIDYLENECLYLDMVQLPLFDSSTYAFADEEQSQTIESLAEECAATLNEWATAEQGRGERFTSLYEAAMEYVPRATEVLGATMESAQALNYAGSQLMTPDDLVTYGDALTDAVAENGRNVWFTYNMGTAIGVLCAVDPLDAADLDSYKQSDLLTTMKQDELDQTLYEEGAALEQNLDESAMQVYKAANIKRAV